MTTYYPRAKVLIRALLDDFGLGVPAAQRTVTVETVPASVEWTRNPPGQADTATVEVEWSLLPFDPRVMRDVLVTVWCGDVGSPAGEIDTSDPDLVQFVGFVDEPRTEHAAGIDRLTLSCRDYRGRLVDTKANLGKLDATVPLSQTIRRVLREVPGYEPDPGDTDRLLVEDDAPLQAYTGKRTWTAPQGASLWDILVGIARETGQVAWYDLTQLRVGNPRTLRPRNADRQRLAVMESVRFLAYGRDVSSVRFTRNMNPMVGKSVVIRARNERARTTTEVRWPTKARDGDQPIALQITGAQSTAQLRRMAQVIYEQTERREVVVEVETSAMADRGGESLVSLKSGDAVNVNVRRAAAGLALGKSVPELVERMAAGGMRREDAERIATAYVDADEFAPLFYVRAARHRWARDEYRLAVTAENLIELEE